MTSAIADRFTEVENTMQPMLAAAQTVMTSAMSDVAGQADAQSAMTSTLCDGYTEVQCPICHAKVLQQDINWHIDTAHADSLTAQPRAKRARNSAASSGAGPSGPTGTASSHAVPGATAPDSLNGDIVVSIDDTVETVPQVSLVLGTGISEPIEDTVVQMTVSDPNLDPELLPPITAVVATQTPVQDTVLAVPEPLPVDAMDSELQLSLQESVLGECSAPPLQESDPIVSLQPQDHLKAHLLGARAQALQHARHVNTSMHAKVLQLCENIQHDVDQSKQGLVEYPTTAAKPSDYNQQCARNQVREELDQVARKTSSNLQSLIDASRVPEDTLAAEKAKQLETIDSILRMAQQFRAETVSAFEELEEKERVEFEACEAAALALEPSLKCVDDFVQQLGREVDDETTKATQVHTDKLLELKREQLRFVNANDSPQRNPIFAKVIEDIASTERLLKEHSCHSETYNVFLEDWKQALALMPTQMPTQTPSPRRSGSSWFLSRIFRRY